MSLHPNWQQRYCEHCTSMVFPAENQDAIWVLVESSDTQSPGCETPLVFGFIDKTQTHYCQKYQGVAIDQHIFLMAINYLRARSKLPSISPPPVNFIELKRKIKCPDCGQSMSTHLYPGPGNLLVDKCIHCNLL